MVQMLLHIYTQYKIEEVCLVPFQKLLKILFLYQIYCMVIYEIQVSNAYCIF